MTGEQVVPLRHPWTWVASAAAVCVAGIVLYSVSTNQAFEWPVVARYMLDREILAGLARTLELTVAAMAIGLVLGTVLALMRLSSNLLLSTLSWLYIWFFRSVPVLVQLIFWYNFGALYPAITLHAPFGPVLYHASMNAVITPLTAALAGLGLAQAAYTAEVIRAGIQSVPLGQTRAAKALGMLPGTIFFRIVFPQAMRVIIPPVGNEVISMMKNTSLVSVIALAELLYTAQLIYARTYQLASLGFAQNFGSGGEAEGLHFVRVLSLGEEFREDVALGGIHEKFWPAVA